MDRTARYDRASCNFVGCCEPVLRFLLPNFLVIQPLQVPDVEVLREPAETNAVLACILDVLHRKEFQRITPPNCSFYDFLQGSKVIEVLILYFFNLSAKDNITM